MSQLPALPGLLLIHGEDRHRVDREARRWTDLVRMAGLDVEILDAPARLEGLRRSLNEMPLFEAGRFVLVRDPPQLAGSSRRGADGADALAEALELRAPTTFLCMANRAKVAPGNPVLAKVARLGGTVTYHPSLRGRDLRAWVEQAAVARGLRLAPAALDHLIRVAGSDLGTVDGELDKLVAYIRDPGDPGPSCERPRSVDLATVRHLIAGDEVSEVWGVVERLLGPRPGEGVAAVDRLLEAGRAPQYLLVTLAGQLNEVLEAQVILSNDRRGASRLAEVLKIPGWRAERIVRHAKAASPRLVESWLRRLQMLDVAGKAGEMDDADGLRTFALTAAGALVKARRSRPQAS